MLVLVVHNSDEVKDVFTGPDKVAILAKLKDSRYWEDICNKLSEMDPSYLGIKVNIEDDGWKLTDHEVHLDMISNNLHHDGDSVDGYTLVTAK